MYRLLIFLQFKDIELFLLLYQTNTEIKLSGFTFLDLSFDKFSTAMASKIHNIQDRIKLTDQTQSLTHKSAFCIPSQIHKFISPTSNETCAVHQETLNPKVKFASWLKEKRSFSKPNSQFSRYADNVSRHRKLVRRGIFNIPALKEDFISKDSTFNKKTLLSGLSQQTLLRKNQPYTQKQTIQAQQHQHIHKQKRLPTFSEHSASRFKSLSHSKLLQHQSWCDYQTVVQTRKQKSLLELEKKTFKEQTFKNKNINSLFKFRTISTQMPTLAKQQFLSSNFGEQNLIPLRNSLKRLIDIEFVSQKLKQKDSVTGKKVIKLQKKYNF